MEFLYEYGLFLAKAVTFVVAIVLLVGVIAGNALKLKQSAGKGQLEIDSLTDKLTDLEQDARALLLDKPALKAYQKAQKKEAKQAKKATEPKKKLFVLDFDGSMDAHEVEALREEVTAILLLAEEGDEVLLKLESGGGVVHGYGLAASQLQRLKDAGIHLTVAVDKVAASGGYMMACVADKVIAAKFAIIGSIGVLAQLPNFNKLLKKHQIEFEQHTAGEFKRTLTMFGENNQQGREKFQEELEDVHQAFKEFVKNNRSQLDIDQVATGEYWHGYKALQLNLIDEISTSDDFLLKNREGKELFSLKYSLKKNVSERLGLAAASAIYSALSRFVSKVNVLSK